MTRIEKCELAILNGFTYNEVTGEIMTPTKAVATKTTKNGYIQLTVRDSLTNAYYLFGHHFAWYFKHKEVVPLIDHKNRIKTDNRILNLRSTTKQKNAFNTGAKGYSFNKRYSKWEANIVIAGKKKFLGYFTTEKEAEEKYKAEKIKHHLI